MDAMDAKAVLKGAITDAQERYKALNPLSDEAEENALTYLPGGNTRSCRAVTRARFCISSPSP